MEGSFFSGGGEGRYLNGIKFSQFDLFTLNYRYTNCCTLQTKLLLKPMFENRSQQSKTELNTRIERSQNSSHEQTCFLLKKTL